ncbi:ester cyclase [Actinoplanes aureus]|uniref:Ester cyclase n=1 Tax=Actinoplanes aureus TaxID=2792083 RepID=A0A931G2G1_9ACTN|nr:ester cyclase [Actinoplanes aureus]MBG0566101.1 ester cyclase [Actinoplanes aureus]
MTQAERQQANEAAIRKMTEAFNSGNTKIVDGLVKRRGNIEKTPLPGTTKDRLGLKLKIQHLRSAFPDGRFTIEEMTSEGDKVTFRWRMEGTQKGAWLGVAATNQKTSFTGTDVVTFQDGLMVEHESLDAKGGMLEVFAAQSVEQDEEE